MPTLDETLKRLAVTFTVRDVMILDKALVCAGDEVDAIRLSKDNPDFSIIPIRRNGELGEYFERDSRTTNAITLSDVIGDGTDLLELVDIFVEREFCFVMCYRQVGGYVHYSDLNHDLVKLTFYVILQAVERKVLGSLRVKDTDQSEYLSRWLPDRFDQLQRQYRRDGDAARGLFNYLNISDILRLGVKAGTIQVDDSLIKPMKETRDGAAHVSENLVADYESVKMLARVKQECLRILAAI